jgi:hypothetical protein
MPLGLASLLGTDSTTWGAVSTVPHSHWVTCSANQGLGTQTATSTANAAAYYSALANQTTATTTTGTVYYWGEQDVTPSAYMALAQNRAVTYHARTAREAQEQAERQRIHAEEYERAMALHKVARERSRELLIAHLTKEQLHTFEKNKWFVVEGGRSKQHYRIRDGGISGNIDVLQGKGPGVMYRLCCHIGDGRVPVYDHLLAQKLHLQYDEDAFVRMANRHAA